MYPHSKYHGQFVCVCACVCVFASYRIALHCSCIKTSFINIFFFKCIAFVLKKAKMPLKVSDGQAETENRVEIASVCKLRLSAELKGHAGKPTKSALTQQEYVSMT